MPLTLSHAVLHVQDMQTMLDYYTRVLGFAITDRGPMGPPGSPEIVFLSQDPGEHHQLAFVGVPKADGRGRMPTPITHGNTWSIYFGDPEGNGVEVFCDTPWHVQQPQGQTWDMTQDDAALLETTRAAFADEPGFGPGDAYVEARKRAS